LKEDRYIYVILVKLDSAYYVFVSTFYASKETLWSAYKKPSFESFCDALLQEKNNFVKLGLISTAGTSNKDLVSQQKDKSKYLKKKHPHHNKQQNKGPKQSSPTYAPNSDKEEKSKSNNIDRHCNFCGKDGHVESKCFKNMKSLEATMKKQKINIDSSSSSFGHALYASNFSFNATSTSSYDEWIIDSGGYGKE
jgi:uncharacterized Rmd1/YagE family protein